MARPLSYTQEIADAICTRLICGESLRSICKSSNMPAASTAFRWLAQISAFSEQYAHARQAQADALAEEILDISNTPLMGQKRTTKANGDVEITEGDMIEHRRLQIDARKWYAGKVAPKKYGDKVDVEHSGNVTLHLLPTDADL